MGKLAKEYRLSYDGSQKCIDNRLANALELKMEFNARGHERVKRRLTAKAS